MGHLSAAQTWAGGWVWGWHGGARGLEICSSLTWGVGLESHTRQDQVSRCVCRVRSGVFVSVLLGDVMLGEAGPGDGAGQGAGFWGSTPVPLRDAVLDGVELVWSGAQSSRGPHQSRQECSAQWSKAGGVVCS